MTQKKVSVETVTRKVAFSDENYDKIKDCMKSGDLGFSKAVNDILENGFRSIEKQQYLTDKNIKASAHIGEYQYLMKEIKDSIDKMSRLTNAPMSHGWSGIHCCNDFDEMAGDVACKSRVIKEVIDEVPADAGIEKRHCLASGQILYTITEGEKHYHSPFYGFLSNIDSLAKSGTGSICIGTIAIDYIRNKTNGTDDEKIIAAAGLMIQSLSDFFKMEFWDIIFEIVGEDRYYGMIDTTGICPEYRRGHDERVMMPAED